jgi:hypothetical protein
VWEDQNPGCYCDDTTECQGDGSSSLLGYGSTNFEWGNTVDENPTTCITPIVGCLNPNACNYDCPIGNSSSNNGLYVPCTPSGQVTYDPFWDGTNSLPGTSCMPGDGCTDSTACNYDAAATCDDGSCTGLLGCIDATALNYDAAATCDDGGCIFSLAVGDSYGGGTVFWIDGGGTSGLIAAALGNDGQSGFQGPWGCEQKNICGPFPYGPEAGDTSIGGGQQNTTDIVNGCNDSPIAAKFANNESFVWTDGQVYDDWFLPSKDELNEMRIVLGPNGTHPTGDFAGAYHWSSTEWDTNNIIREAWSQSFSGTTQVVQNKNQNFHVRIIRAF